MSDIPSNMWQLLQWRALQSADKVFLIDALSGQQLSFSEFERQATELACVLQSRGIGRGTVVAWQMPTCIEAALLMFALARLGAVQTPVIHLYREREIEEILSQAKPQFFVVVDDVGTDKRLRCVKSAISSSPLKPQLIDFSDLSFNQALSLPELEGFLPAPEAVRWYFFTSGTTARPKGTRHSDQSLMAGGFFLGGVLDVSYQDVGSIAYPVAHIGGAVYFAMSIKVGISVVLLANYTPELVIDSFNRYQVSLAGGSTAHYQLLLQEQRKSRDKPLFPSLRLLSGGGAAKPAALYWQMKEELGLRIVHAYGMTEAPITSSNTPYDTDEQLTHTDGEVLPELELKIINADGSRVEPGESGEIILRGPNLCQGYLLDEQTDAAFDKDGFFHTGDLGKMDFDGHLTITGRLKEIIIRKGENISAREIEELLAKHPLIKDAAVIGLPDEERGELVCAVVELVGSDDSFTMGDMQAFLREHNLMPQKIPERLEVMQCLPRNQSLQKVQKNLLQKRFSQ